MSDSSASSARQGDIARRLAGFASAFRLGDAPREARAVLGLSLLDFAAVALAGRGEAAGRICRGMVLEEGGAGEARLIGADGAKVPARAAALANGTTAHALDYDDTHFRHIGHLAVVIFPAALAVAERQGTGGRAFLEAALIGYEAAAHVGAWLGRAHYEAGFHQTATSGAFAATLAAARLLGLGEKEMARALGLAATRAGGLKASFATMAKPYNAGAAAALGVEAALLVARGFGADPGVLAAFAATHGGAADAAALSGLGRAFLLPAISHKYHACCHGTHAALEALAAAMGRARGQAAGEAPGGGLAPGDVAPGDVTAVEITIHPRWLAVCNIAAPRTGLEAKFSYAQVVAMALSGRDTAALESFSNAACADPALAALRARVRVAGDPALPDTAARVVLRLSSGAALEGAHDLAAPAPLALRRRRIREKATALVGEARAERLWQAIAGLEEDAPLSRFTALL